MEDIVHILVELGNDLLDKPYEKIKFTQDDAADDLLNNLANYPHAFVLACVMDRQIKAEKAWVIPYTFSLELKGFQFSKILRLSRDWIREFFITNNLHRFPDIMADNFYHAVQQINQRHEGNAANIWSNTPKSATVIRRFLQFKGIGIKIATMATRILVRDFKIPIADKLCIDISPDVQVRRVFTRLGLIDKGASGDELIYRARELNPEYPGIFDVSAWDIGRRWCRPTNPNCEVCYLQAYCPRIGVT